MIEFRKPWRRQPSGLVRPADAFADMAQGWIASNPLVNMGSAGVSWSRQGTPSRIITPNGVGEYSDTYANNNRYTGASTNPAALNWPGVTVITTVSARASPIGVFASIAAWVASGEFYGGFNLTIETSDSGARFIYFRAGDSGANLTPTVYNVQPTINEWDVGDRLTIVAGFNKNTIWIVVNRNGTIAQNSSSHVFGWRNLTSENSILGYVRSGNRTTPHAVSMAAVIPRDLRAKALDLASNPWQLFAPRRIFVPQAAIVGGLPTLSAATYVPGSLTASGFRPRVTATY